MLGLGWLVLKQVQEALKSGRLEDAQRLLAQPGVQGHKRSYELQEQLARAFVERGDRQLRRDDAAGAWADLLKAEQVGATDPSAVRLRQALTRLGLAEVRALLEAGEPVRAAEAAALLRDRAVRQPELDPVEEAAREWVKGRELADRGDFALAFSALERVGRLLAHRPASLEKFRAGLEERNRTFAPLLVQLHATAQQERWHEVVQLAERVLAAAPQHVEARRLRTRAWKALEPVTVASGPIRLEPARAAETAPAQFLLWVDGVGGYLVCLAHRVTFGQAIPEACVDVPLFADISRLHATLTRDPEGYLFEAQKTAQVNGKQVDKALLHSGDRVTLGTSCQFQFLQPARISASARLELVSGHRLRQPVDAVLLMADTLILGPGPQAHVTIPDLKQPVILYRHKDGLGVRHTGRLAINGQPCEERGNVEAGATVTGDDFSLTLEQIAAGGVCH